VIEQILNLIKSIWPVRIIYPDELGVYVLFGKWHWNKGPGLYFIIPSFTEVFKVKATEQVCDFPQMAVTTKDMKGILIDGCLSYVITDAYKAIFKVKDLNFTLMAKTMGAVYNYVSWQNHIDCTKQRAIQQAIFDSLEEVEADFGIEILELDLTTNIKAIGLYISR